MPGAPDPRYVAARGALLDALEALGEQRAAIVLVGAQAVYLHTGAGTLAVAEHTTDGDLAIDPRLLRDHPLLQSSLAAAGFVPHASEVGSWVTTRVVDGQTRIVNLDLLVPEALGGTGRRAARLAPHHERSARKARGLEAAVVDRVEREIAALDHTDLRTLTVSVASPAALIVSKVHKIAERADSLDRLRDKDALDVYRLLQAVPTADLAGRLAYLRSEPIARETTEYSLAKLPELFGTRNSIGCVMATRAAGPFAASATIAESIVLLTRDLLEAL